MKSSYLRIVDKYIGTLLYLLCWSLKSRKNASKGRHLLVIKLWAVGESVLLLPSLKNLHKKGYSITVLCTRQNKAAFERQPFIENIYLFDFNPFAALATIFSIRRKKFSAVIDAEPFTRFSAVVSVLSGAPITVGFANRPLLYTKIANVNENRHAVDIFNGLFSAIEPLERPAALVPVVTEHFPFKHRRKSLAIHAGSASTARTRRWPEEKFALLCDYFSEKGWDIFLIGSKDEAEINHRILALCKNKDHIKNMSGRLSLRQLAYLFSKTDLIIANDSGPMHIAAASGTPTIGLFGPNTPERFGPFGEKCIGIRKDHMPPCILPFRAKFPECEHDHMKDLNTKDVIEAADKLC
jgi:heptosyltransferase-2